ncbi:iron chelate uptake ABC transporter family permease subunit [Corynebacterium epidermidicanis]|uniref:ABC-type enterochelin transport system, permease component n=1 Tax=Corynebacterium epidermidicanis TaxID=1050174 RepID=A0A0G3GSQ4_9CORY|nr:iron chelate uptake ABC transporter family permease subunit [Corynebacterium epidermidicanis]AKK02593.1 ABC-type enterochelin transport system, permease component [Corynebacterium epidermidicanis]
MAQRRASTSFGSQEKHRRFWLIFTVLIVIAAVSAFGLLAWKNPLPMDSPGFWLIAERRATAVIVMAIVAIAQACATVTFQTVTNNRIITPSIMGFEALYMVIQTSTVYFFGVTGLLNFTGRPQFLMQVALMVGFSLVLYGWLLTGRNANMQVMLLVGIILGGGMASLSTFMRRLLSPSEFDLLAAKMFGSVNNANKDLIVPALILVGVTVLLLLLRSRALNIVALGPDVATNLGLNYRANTIFFLVLVSVLISTSTALVGPMTFLGFLVATLAYQCADTYDHRYVLPLASLIAFAVLTAAYFTMTHIFYAQGVVSIIIELVGGSVFLLVLMKKGRL